MSSIFETSYFSGSAFLHKYMMILLLCKRTLSFNFWFLHPSPEFKRKTQFDLYSSRKNLERGQELIRGT
ncbi:hypothetical protein HMI56_003380 [Coelomomyces lativittatus]|nr:hypothetical protein HMI56_003380 [Coelomomyces lativittatus]